ncbi:MAG TPA: hypothetical protein IAA60_06010 [Candidatus Ornithomonoglobus intestinigallinarum]|uniref:GTPase-associated protein 1 N-terminal domain-containing protein n=1 Tax=Candidatus Ornithomonoglobus intestinigallinarum TaxID=2840894 RepID=A0A9D1H4Q6_9FIRM|nr:hypothetical protein [Candidatus Ornithomonoglobus intestinigallinarum]
MKVYQMIYTSVLHSLSDQELGLSNQSGLRVYSCSQGLEREDLDEVARFSSYRLPKNNKQEYSEVYCDPKVPEQFPKTFRTLKLADGKYAAIQSVFSGVDYQGHEGNFFSHALIFDNVEPDFFPEQYCRSKTFRTYLTEKEQKKELVHYLPVLEEAERDEGFEKEIYEFIGSHKKELSYLINSVITLMMGSNIKNICIATLSAEETEKYLVSLKYLLPRDVSPGSGISTYNVYLPSDKQDSICLHGTIKGKNNITREAIESKQDCMYIDMDRIDTASYEISPLLSNWTVEELREEYTALKIHSVTGLLDWVASFENTDKPGMGGKLLRLRESAGTEAFAKRAAELYPLIKEKEYEDVRFEVTKVMYDNIDLFPGLLDDLTDSYITQMMTKLAKGERYDFGAVFSSMEHEKNQVAVMKKKIPEIMAKIGAAGSKISDKSKFVLLGFFAQLKHKYGDESWKDFFKGNRMHLTTFVEMAAGVVITGYGVKPFSPPSNWEKEDLDELISFFESSTEDEKLRTLCLKYIYSNTDTDWSIYGVSLTKHTKTRGEQEEDMRKIRSILSKVGYEPYQRGKYLDVKGDVRADVEGSMSPLLLTRLLDTYYRWQRCYGNQAQAKKYAQKFRLLLLEMKRTQRTCYDYVIPKLALEIIETPGHYHEIMINMDTMCTSFWNWFIIGYSKCKRDDEKMLTYARVYEASKTKLSKLPMQMRRKLRAEFTNIE